MRYLAFVIAASLALLLTVSSPVLAQIPPESPGEEPSATPGSGNTEQGPGMDQDNPQQSETSPDDPSQTNQGGSEQYGDDQGDPDQMNSDSGEAQPTPDEARPEAEPGVRE
jgi:hypothetical protein